MPTDGDEVYINSLETAILFEIGKSNPLVSTERTIAILESLIAKVKGEADAS